MLYSTIYADTAFHYVMEVEVLWTTTKGGDVQHGERKYI